MPDIERTYERSSIEVGRLMAEWRASWEDAGRPEHDCETEACPLRYDATICGVCGSYINEIR